MIALQVCLTLLRELLRALAVPLQALCYLPRRHHWREQAKRALANAETGAPQLPLEALRAFLDRAPPRRAGQPHLFLSAGEASGEAHATRLLQALTAPRDGSPALPVRCTAFGGEPLAQAGANVVVQLSEHAVMGVLGVLRQLPLILRAHARFLRLLRDDPPDLIVLVDYPGLHLVMAKAAKRAGVPVLHYVAPQYWAWGPWRLQRYRRAVDATLTILPFETAFFRHHGLPAAYIGHPLLDELAQHPADPAATAAVQARPTLVLLPGSRRAEISANLPGMLQIAHAVRALDANARIVLPHRNPARAGLLQTMLASSNADFVEYHCGPLSSWLAGARLVIAKSGTGSLEACLHGTPTVVVYQLRSQLAVWGYHSLLSVPWIAAANLIANRPVVPEFCFHDAATWSRVQDTVLQLWSDPQARSTMATALAEVRLRLGDPGASERTAAILRRFLAATSPP